MRIVRIMGLCQIKCCLFLLVCLSLLHTLSGTTSISDGVFGSAALGERRLLQAKQRCPVSFEFQNYTALTNSCKGPDYLAKLCCPAFKTFACPFADYLNDLTNDCATAMFSYMNLRGHYPPGLFANECKEGADGLVCDDMPPTSSPNRSSSSSLDQKNTWHLLLFVGSFLLLQFT